MQIDLHYETFISIDYFFVLKYDIVFQLKHGENELHSNEITKNSPIS